MWHEANTTQLIERTKKTEGLGGGGGLMGGGEGGRKQRRRKQRWGRGEFARRKSKVGQEEEGLH